MFSKIPVQLFLTYALPFLLFSCKGMKQAAAPEPLKIPETFRQDTSRESVGDMSVKNFFSDSLLVSLIEKAIQSNPDVLIATQRIEASRAFLLQSKGAYLPSISGDAFSGTTRYGDYTMNGVGNFDTNLSPNTKAEKKIPNPTPDYFLGFSSTWELDIWGRLRNKKRAAYSRMLATEKGKHLIITSLVAEVAELYFTLLILDQELQIIRNNIILQQQAVETILILKKGGRTNELAVRQSTAQLLNTKSLEFFILQDIIATENTLNFLLGRFPQEIPRSKTINRDFFPGKISSGIPADMLLRRPDIQQAELDLRASEQELKSARAAFMPALKITGLAGYNAFAPGVLIKSASLTYGILSGLTAPIFQGNRIKAGYRASQASNREAYHQYQKTILNGFREVHTDLARIENYQKAVDLKDQEVDTLHQAVTSADALFRAGYASYLEVIITQKNALEAQLGLINTRKEQYMSWINLYRSLGGGWK
ncbi:MAG: TolC family protein [Cytophagaceae bacterium]